MAVLRVIEVVIKGTQEGQDYRNVLHFAPTNNPTDENLNAFLLALAAAVAQCFVAQLLPHIADEFLYIGTDARQIWPSLSDPQSDTTGAGEGGISAGTLPSFNSMLVQKRTGGGGRRGRGRMFLPAPVEGDQNGSFLSTTGTTHVVNFITCIAGKFLVPSNTEPNKMVVLSRTTAAANGGSMENATRDVTSLVSMNAVACLRRRKSGVGS